MPIVVQKYGGSSRRRRREHQARREAHRRRRRRPATTSSSSSRRWGTPPTSCSTSPRRSAPLPPARELDMLLTAGERISMALRGHGHHRPRPHRALVHRQPGRRHHRQRPRQGQDHRRHPGPHHRGARRGRTSSIVAGLPGRQPGHQGDHHARPRRHRHHRRRAGRGARGDVCEIYTDVDGVFTADPRIVPTRPQDRPASPTRRCSSWPPAAPRSCTCGASSTPAATTSPSTSGRRSARTTGTWSPTSPHPKEAPWKQPIIAGVAHDRSEAKITVVGVPDKVGVAARIFEALAAAADQHRHDRAERLGGRDRPDRHLLHAARERRPDRRCRRSHEDPGRGRLRRSCSTTTRSARSRLVGAGMRSHPGVSATFFGALAAGRRQHRDDLHLGDPDLGRHREDERRRRGPRRPHAPSISTPPTVEAVVYGGTGR